MPTYLWLTWNPRNFKPTKINDSTVYVMAQTGVAGWRFDLLLGSLPQTFSRVLLLARHRTILFTVIIPPANEVWGVYRNHPVCLYVRPSVQSKLNGNLDHNLLTKGDILHKCIPCEKTFLSIPKLLTSWPWLLTYFWKNLTLTITFKPKEVGLSYFTCISCGKAFPLQPKFFTWWPWPWVFTFEKT